MFFIVKSSSSFEFVPSGCDGTVCQWNAKTLRKYAQFKVTSGIKKNLKFLQPNRKKNCKFERSWFLTHVLPFWHALVDTTFLVADSETCSLIPSLGNIVAGYVEKCPNSREQCTRCCQLPFPCVNPYVKKRDPLYSNSDSAMEVSSENVEKKHFGRSTGRKLELLALERAKKDTLTFLPIHPSAIPLIIFGLSIN